MVERNRSWRTHTGEGGCEGRGVSSGWGCGGPCFSVRWVLGREAMPGCWLSVSWNSNLWLACLFGGLVTG